MLSNAGQSAENGLLVLADAEALREHLDALNDAGTDYKAAGMDSRGEAFLIALSGCYAEAEVVLYGDPWDSEVDYGTSVHCDECQGHAPSRMDSLRFPVRILTRVIPPGVTKE